jgi:sigma-B regulation protein RsbU (phosphoserine phosphatase)
MRIDLGDIKINNGQSIIDARKKLYKLVMKLNDNSLLASRLSAVVSQACKHILNSNKPLSLSLSLDTENSGYSSFNLSLISSESIEGRYFDNSVFEYVRPEILIEDHYCKEVSLRINAVEKASKDLVWQLQDIVNEKSRDELIDEIKDTNIELKESLENLKRTTSAKERMESELNIGRDIQMSMLPLEFPPFPDRKEMDILAALHPAREVGGDFYDFFFIDDTRLCFCVGDVSGKGVPAALFMAMTKTLIKSRATDDFSTASIITHINDELSEDNKSSMFVTVFICILNTETGELICTNAGHNPPFIKRKDGSITKLDELHGPVVGAIYGMTYKEGSVNLHSGDVVLLYTDGVTEAMNESGSLYSEGRLVNLLEESTATSLNLLLDEITCDVSSFEGEAEQADDITLIAVSFHGGKKSKMASRDIFVVKNALSEIETVNNRFAEFAKQHNIEDTVINVFRIVFDEMLNNIVSYAYDDTEEHEIEINIHFSDSRINVSIIDDGKPFNPLGLNPPDTSASLEDRGIGGLGIHLVRKMMDDIHYQRKIDKNVLSMTKVIKPNNG